MSLEINPEINLFSIAPPSEKKRLLVIITQSELGGAQQFLYQLLKRLSLEQYEILAATGADGDHAFSKMLASVHIPTHNLKNLRRDIRPIDDLRAISEIKELIESYRPTTLLLNSSKAGFIGALAAKKSSIKTRVIYRIGGWSFNDPRPFWQKKLWIFLERLSSRWKDYIIVNNIRDLDQAKKLNIVPRKGLTLIHNGIDPYQLDFLPQAEAREELLRRVKTLEKPTAIVGIIANLYPAKGLEFLIRASSRLKQGIIICVIGDGPERGTLERVIEHEHAEGKVFLLGRLPQASRYLQAFDVFVSSSVKEGFSWGILEAMAAKLPVVATTVGSAPEMIQDGVSGYLVPPRDPGALAEKINILLEKESVSKEFAIQAHQTVLRQFSVTSMVDQMESLII